MIEYILLPNTIGRDGEPPTGYHARVVQTEERTRDDFIRTMMKLRGGITRGDAEQQLDLVERAFIDEIANGNNVNLPGFFHAVVAIRGNVPTPESPLTEDNTLHVTMTASSAVTKAIAGSPTHRVSEANSGIFISHVHDIATGTYDDKLTPGMVLQIYGSKIKLAGDAPTVGVYIVDADGESTQVAPAAISRNGPKQIDLVIPNLPNGAYQVRVTTQYSGSGGILLKAARSYTFPTVLTVGGGS